MPYIIILGIWDHSLEVCSYKTPYVTTVPALAEFSLPSDIQLLSNNIPIP